MKPPRRPRTSIYVDEDYLARPEIQ